jgi:hypothetical protein
VTGLSRTAQEIVGRRDEMLNGEKSIAAGFGDVEQLGFADDLLTHFAMFLGAILQDHLNSFLDKPGKYTSRIMIDDRRFLPDLGEGFIQEFDSEPMVVHDVVNVIEYPVGIRFIKGIKALLLVLVEQSDKGGSFHDKTVLPFCTKNDALPVFPKSDD